MRASFTSLSHHFQTIRQMNSKAKSHVRRFRDGLDKDETMADFEKRMMEQMRKAFFDSIQQIMESEHGESTRLADFFAQKKRPHCGADAIAKAELDGSGQRFVARMLRGGAFKTEHCQPHQLHIRTVKAACGSGHGRRYGVAPAGLTQQGQNRSVFCSMVAPFLQHVHTLLDETTRRVVEIRQHQLQRNRFRSVGYALKVRFTL